MFFDESGVKTNMTRLYGRAHNGKCCHDKTSDGYSETVTVLSSIRLDGRTHNIMFDGADNPIDELTIEKFDSIED